ncbi:MAG: dTDP-4-dehydrorhamnose reductase [gamma proteobacterium symbiont of Bathyaustriella thionipta]|nr:dTDP-4-dehydrorhamnose reductase [gamma proteobacterium symbiont of Bathyaustriella thionipta]
MNQQNRFLLIGSHGQLGNALSGLLEKPGVVVTADYHAGADIQLDLADTASCQHAFTQAKPDYVINCAAYTQVDKAEKDSEQAWRVNAEAPGCLAALCAQNNAVLVHFSTDYVFSGVQKQPWTERDEAKPASEYGRSKLAGEQAVLNSACHALVFRTSWIFSQHGQNFLLTMMRLLQERDELRVVNDQIGAPTSALALAEASIDILQQFISGKCSFEQQGGLYHMSCGGQTSWYGFTCAIRDLIKADCELTPIPTTEYPTPAARPLWSVLDNGRLQRDFNVQLPDWKSALRTCLQTN